MKLSNKAQKIYSQISKEETKLGDLRKIGKDIKKDHDLALELWSTKEFLPRQLAVLILDKKLLTKELIDELVKDIELHEYSESTQLGDWLMANQLMKDKRIINLIETWENSPSVIQRRIFWYYQGRLRWTGQTPPLNTADLIKSIQKNILKEEPEVQWAMNFTAGFIGIYDAAYRSRCVKIGEETGLYKDEMVSKGCTPKYLPEFIRIEVNKRKT